MPRKSSSAASPSMAALAAAAAAGEGADAAGAGGMVPPSGEEDKKPQMAPAASVGASSSSAAVVAVRKGAVGGRPTCKVERCGADLADAGRYNRRHKVCEPHSKAPVVLVAGLRQRFCQQCSRFHELSEFDDEKRSCRRCLVGHNERRRRAPPPSAD